LPNLGAMTSKGRRELKQWFATLRAEEPNQET
jgi:hypothetical protein